jgi:hypothetical protein
MLLIITISLKLEAHGRAFDGFLIWSEAIGRLRSFSLRREFESTKAVWRASFLLEPITLVCGVGWTPLHTGLSLSVSLLASDCNDARKLAYQSQWAMLRLVDSSKQVKKIYILCLSGNTGLLTVKGVLSTNLNRVLLMHSISTDIRLRMEK